MILALRYLPLLLQSMPCELKNEDFHVSSFEYVKNIDKLIEVHNKDNLAILNEYLDLLHK